MAIDRTLRVRGALRAMVSVGSTLLLATEHEEGHAMALWRVDVDSGKLDAAPLPGGATDILLDGEAVFVAGTDGHVYGGAALKGPLKALGAAMSPPPAKLVPLHDGRLAALCGATLRVLRKDSGAVLQELELPEAGSALASDPSGVFIVVGTSRGNILVFDCEDKAEYLQGESAKLHEGEVTAICFEAGDQRFMSTGVDRRLLTTHVRGKLEPEDRGGGGMHDKAVRAIAYGPESQGDDRRFYTAGDDGVIKAWPAGATRKRPTTARDGVPRALGLAFVAYKERAHLAVAMDNGARLFAVDAGGKVDNHVITYRGALDHARQELSASEPARRQAALRQLAEDNDQASIDLIAGQAGSDADHALRLEATTLLGASGNRRAHGHLEKLLRSRDEKVRMAALEGLRALDGQEDLGPLESALGTRHADIGVAAVQALAALAKSDDRAYTRLVRALDDDPAQVRNEALSQLEGLHAPGDPEASLAGLRSGKADLRRLALLRFFQRGLLERPATQVALRRHAEDKDADVRQAAFEVAVLSRPQLAAALRYHDKDLHRRLHELETWDQAEPPKLPRTKRVDPKDLSDADLRPLLQAMASRALDTCLRGASGLADLKDPRAFGALLQLSRESDEAARVAACKALAALGEPRALGRLRMMLRDPASAARDAAFTALASLLEKTPLDAAEAGLLTEHADVRRRGLQLLVKELRAGLPADADHRAYALLRRALDDADSSVRSEAFKGALNLNVAGGGADTLRFVLSSLHVDVRREVLNEVMAQMEADWAWSLLLELLADPDRSLRREAFDFAIKKGRGRALEPLEVALKGKHADLRVEATRQLTKKRQADARDLLIAALDDAEEEVRSLALNALVHSGDDDAVRAAMESAHADVRVRAATARSLHGDPAALKPLMAIIAEPEPTEGAVDVWKTQVTYALNGLSNLGDEAALDAVAAHLDSKHAEHRLGATAALARVSRPGRTEVLREALRHDDAEVRKAAAFSLAFNGDPAGATLIFAPPPERTRRSSPRRHGSSSSAVDHKPFIAALGLGKLAREALLAFLDQDDFKARMPALAAVLLLEHSGGGAAPSMLMAALSAGNADSRLIGASGLQEFPNADDYEAFVVRTLNERPSNQKAWELSTALWRGLAAFLSSANPQHRAYAGVVLSNLTEDEPDALERAWRALSERAAGELPGLLSDAARRSAERDRGDAHALNELVFGAYVGLTRTGGYSAGALRQRALLRLLEMGQEDAALVASVIPVLVQALGDDQGYVRKTAFDALRTLGMEAGSLGAEALAVGLADIGVMGLKLLAEDAGGADGDAVLREIMLDRDDGMEISAADLLVERGDRPSVAKAALDARSDTLRQRALSWLREDYAAHPAAQDALRGAAGSRFRGVRTQAALALGHLRDAAGFEPLLAVLAGDDRRAQRDAVDSLIALGDPRTPAALLDRVDTDPAGSADVDRLLRSAGVFRDRSVVPRLFAYADDRSKRSAALDALLNISGYDQPIEDIEDERPHDRAWMKAQHPRHDDLLAQLLDAAYLHGDTRRLGDLIQSARWALGAQVDPALAPLINVSTPWVRERALSAIAWRLQHRGGPADTLVSVLESKDAALRFLAAEGLALAGRKEGLAVLLASVELMPELDYRRRAVVALGQLADASALDLLIKLASEEGHALQEQAAEALGHIASSPRADQVFTLLSGLAGGEGGVATHALSGLRWFGSGDAWALIRRRAKDGSWQVRERCAELLAFDEAPEAGALLERLLKEDDDWDVIEAAYQSLRRREGPEALGPAMALLLSDYPRLDDDALGRVAEHASASQVFSLLMDVREEHRAEVFQPLVEALLARDPLPLAEAAQALANPERDDMIAVAARVLGRAGQEAALAHGAALSENTSRTLDLWLSARAAAQRGERGALIDRIDALGAALERLLWACGRLVVGEGAATRAAALTDSDAAAARVRRAALLVLAEGVGGDEAIAVLTAAAAGSDAEARAIAASGLSWRASSSAAIEAAMGDPATLGRLLAGRDGEVQALRAGATNAHHAGVALPQLVSRGDVEGLAGLSADRSLAEATRLGALEGLGRLSDEAVEAPLLAVATAEEEDEALRRAAWRALRRARRARAQKELSR